MTEFLISDTPARMGRKKRWAEDMQAQFSKGTFARVAELLSEGEDRTDFVRDAVEREIVRREGLRAPERPAAVTRKGKR